MNLTSRLVIRRSRDRRHRLAPWAVWLEPLDGPARVLYRASVPGLAQTFAAGRASVTGEPVVNAPSTPTPATKETP